jgi:hypothetical protein
LKNNSPNRKHDMPVTLEDIRRERERRLAAPAETLAPLAQKPQKVGITLDDIRRERERRAAGGFDPFNPPGGTGDPSAEYRTDPGAEAIQEAFNPATAAVGGVGAAARAASRLGAGAMGASIGGSSSDVAGPTAGEIAGGAVGTLVPGAAVAVPALAAAGAGIGLMASRWLQGEPVTSQEVFGEAILSAIPETVTGVGKGVLRASKKARQARFADLAEQARREAGEVFQPPEKAMVSGLFDQVAESGVKADTGAIQRFMGEAGPRYDDLLKEVRRIDNSLKSGGQFEDMVSRLQAGQRGAFDLGRLQALHSEVGKRLQTTNLPFEAKELLRDFNYSIDNAIYNGLAKGQHAAKADSTRDTLRMARAGWAKVRRTEELQGLVEDAITAEGNGTAVKINLGKIRDTIRRGTGKRGKSILRGFEHDPQAKQSFNAFLDRLGPKYDAITVSLADLPPQTLGMSLSKIGEWMATIYSSTPRGREAFENLVISGQGKLTHSSLANLANAFIRYAGEEQEARSSRRSSAVQPGRQREEARPSGFGPPPRSDLRRTTPPAP